MSTDETRQKLYDGASEAYTAAVVAAGCPTLSPDSTPWDEGIAAAVDHVLAEILRKPTATGFVAVETAWQRSAQKVIDAANQLMLDLVTGDADPRILAQALIDGGFDKTAAGAGGGRG